ncbi:unnamed protein product [Moneuplotes crassus]|uniref:Uncharacterized protein n=1 Tax=Euplotes crassus TaxID=5936 RepID=A0AAD1X9F1_EUPCR|nr:unnamed protein product [Moneuplotes crassus]
MLDKKELNKNHKLFQRNSKESEDNLSPQGANRPLSRRDRRSELDREDNTIGTSQGVDNRPRTSSVVSRPSQKDKKDTVKMICSSGTIPKGGFEHYKNSIKIFKAANDTQQEIFEIESQGKLKTSNRDLVLPGSACCSRKKEKHCKFEKPKISLKKAAKLLAKGCEIPEKLESRKQLLDLQREKLQNKFSKVKFFTEEDKKVTQDDKKSKESIKRNITLHKKVMRKKSSSNLIFKNSGSPQGNPSFGDTLKFNNLPDFPVSPFGDEFPVNSNFKFSTLLPSKSEGLFKSKESEKEQKAIPVFPIIEQSKDQSPSKFLNLADKKAVIADNYEPEIMKEDYNPFTRRLPRVKKRSASKGIDSEEKQVSTKMKSEGIFDSWVKSRQKTSRPSKKHKSKHRVLLDSIRKAIKSPHKKESSEDLLD